MLDALLILVVDFVCLFPYPVIGAIFSLPALYAIARIRTRPSFPTILIFGLTASILAFITSMLITSHVSTRFLFPSTPAMEAYPYRDKVEDIQHEAWLRSIIPPPLQKDCFSYDEEVCEAFMDGSMMIQKPEKSWKYYLSYLQEDMLSFVICGFIVGIGSIYLRRRKIVHPRTQQIP